MATSDQKLAQKSLDAFINAQKLAAKDEEDCCDVSDRLTRLSALPSFVRGLMYRDPLFGDYHLMRPARLSIAIDALNSDHSVIGRSIASGNERALTGTWVRNTKGYQLMLAEPTDLRADGAFNLMFSPKKKMLGGTWQSYDVSRSHKSFALKKHTFKYDAKSGENSFMLDRISAQNPSVELITTELVENLGKPHIRTLRNLIYARHGYIFADANVRQQFEAEDWYVPLKSNVDADLTEIEKQNLAILKRYEAYADEHYAIFWR